jgi:DNA-binding Xre family transcriptional regulator
MYTLLYKPSYVNPGMDSRMLTPLKRIKRMVRLKVREVAEAKGMSMARLARRADIDYKTVQRIYRDPLREVTTTTLDKLAKALGVDVNELIESVPDDTKDK